MFAATRSRGQLTKLSFMVGVTERALRSTRHERQPPNKNSLEKRFAFGFEPDCPFALGHMSCIAKLHLVPAGCRLEKGS